MSFYPWRMVELRKLIEAGMLYPRWAPDYSAGFGLPFFIFHPPLLYYVTVLLGFLGLGVIGSMNAALFTFLALAGLGMYLLAYDHFGNHGGLAAASAYLFAPYFLSNLYVRNALMDFCAFASIPFAFWGVERFTRHGRYGFLLIGSVATALTILSSTTIALITFPFIVILVLWIAWNERSWTALSRGSLCLGFALGLSAFFVIPALLERGFVHLERVTQDYLEFRKHFVYPWQFIFSPWGYGPSLPGPKDGMSFQVGSLHILALLTTALLLPHIWRRFRRAGEFAVFTVFVVLTSLFFASTWSAPLWEYLPLLHNLEFPWRFLSPVAAATAWMFGVPFLFLSHRKWLLWGWLAFVVVAQLVVGLPKAVPRGYLADQDMRFTPSNIVKLKISANTYEEMEPIWVRERPMTNWPGFFVTQDKSQAFVAKRLSPTYIRGDIELSQSTRLYARQYYYPGWKLFVDGVEHELSYHEPTGVIEFTLAPGRHQVELRFTDTPVRAWSDRLSSIVALVLLGWGLAVGLCGISRWLAGISAARA